ncbi:MAG: autotransporter domain-containing protein, partial [Akkermansia sp.]|nr:autotransporter domain-containing protein [Akkermansia sp.]
DNQEAEDGFFRKGGDIYTLFDNAGDNASLVLTNDVKISMLGGSVTLPAGTYTDDIEVSTVGEVDMAAYYMNSENHSVKVSAIQQKSNNSTTKVVMAEGTGTLTVDDDMAVEATGGEIKFAVADDKTPTVSGSIKNAKVSGTTGADDPAGIVAAKLEDATMTGKLTVTGEASGTLALDAADVTLTGDVADTGNLNISGAKVTTSGTSSLSTDVAEGSAVKLGTVIQNTGDLTLSGSYDVSLLDAETVTAGFVDVNGDVTTNGSGFKRDDGCTVLVVNNANDGRLEDGESLQMTIGTRYDGVLDKTTGVVTFGAGIDYSTYYVKETATDDGDALTVSDIQSQSGGKTGVVHMASGELIADSTIEVDVNNAKLTTTGDDTVVKGTLTDVEIIAEGGEISGRISGGSSVVATSGTTMLSGENSYSGGTEVNGGELAVGSDKALGTGKVSLKDGALNLGSQAVANDIEAAGGVLRGADQYLGDLVVSEDLTIEGSATAKSITMLNKAGIVLQSAATYSRRSTPADAQVSTDAMYVRTEGDGSFTGSLTLNEGGLIELNNGNSLVVTGTLTLGNGTKLVLNGDYAAGDTLVSATESLTLGDVTLVYDNNAVVMEQQGNSLVLVGNFKQEEATASTLSNWGIATASRAVVNAVRGQRSNTGCIANGKGTAWVASLASKHDINGSDIDISGAAVGADMQVGRNSRIGIALGYAEGEVQPAGLRQVDQEGSYLVVYGEHGLKKLSATSCLSMDWVAAYGTTDSEVGGLKWEQDSLQLNSRVNWNKKVNNRLCMSVFGGLEYFANDSATVDGVKTGSIQNLRGEIGVGARYVAWGTPAVTDGKSGLVLAKGCEKLVLNGEVRYMNDMVRSNPVIRMNGLSGMGQNPGRQGIGIEAGATYRIGERWSATANYGFNTMEDSKEHRLNIGAAYTF